jgi:hypothetical protein
MNAKGKELMAKRIVAAIKHTLNVCKKTPISMKWKGDPSKENQGLGKQKMKLEKEEIQSKTRMTAFQWKKIIVEGEEDETAMKASRYQKIPVTRRDDFLWTATSKKHSR